MLTNIKEWLDARLVPEWHKAWKWLSTWGFIVLGAAPHINDVLSQIGAEYTKAGLAIPAPIGHLITATAIIGLIGRLWNQDLRALFALPPAPPQA